MDYTGHYLIKIPCDEDQASCVIGFFTEELEKRIREYTDKLQVYPHQLEHTATDSIQEIQLFTSRLSIGTSTPTPRETIIKFEYSVQSLEHIDEDKHKDSYESFDDDEDYNTKKTDLISIFEESMRKTFNINNTLQPQYLLIKKTIPVLSKN